MRRERWPIPFKAPASPSTAGSSGRTTRRSGGASWRVIPKPPSMPISRISPSAASWSKVPTISAASGASSISPRTSSWCRPEGAAILLEAEPEIVEHMNDDHADAVELYATALADGEPGALAHDRHRHGRLRSSCSTARRVASCSPSLSPPLRKPARSWSGLRPRLAPGGNNAHAAAMPDDRHAGLGAADAALASRDA